MTKRHNYNRLTLEWAREIEGWLIGKTEYWQPSSLVMEMGAAAAKRNVFAVNEAASKLGRNPNSGVRKDLFGFIDAIGLDVKQNRIVAIQSTSIHLVSAHALKIKRDCSEAAIAWNKCKGSIEIWGWKRHDAFQSFKDHNGKNRKKKWMPKIQQITFE